MKKMLILCLVAAVLLTGCMTSRVEDLLNDSWGVTKFEDMVYTRPDLAEVELVLAESCATAAAGESLDAVVDAIFAFYDVYDAYATNMSLADIHYCMDLTDTYWEEEYNFCAENAAIVDAGLEELYYALAASPLRDTLEGDDYFGAGFFDYYDGESIWDETFIGLLEQEAALETRYYELSADALEWEYYSEEFFASECYDAMVQNLVELVALRQEIAAYVGYDSYAQFAYDFYYYRDYTPAQTMAYLAQVKSGLTPLYREVNASDIWYQGAESCSELQTYGYVRSTARAMGGIVEEAFDLMDAGHLYDISYGENKYDSSFELYLSSYYQPFIFMNPAGTVYDKLVFAHEFGHFVNDYACGGSYAGVDVSEVFSQGMEYLSLFCADGAEALEQLKLADCLFTYVEQAAYAEFEHKLYEMTPDALTAENVAALYAEVGLDYGFDSWEWDSRDFVTITHFYTEPMYVISYVFSNDVAFSLYQMEKAEEGAGVSCLLENITSGESYLLTFAESAGLDSPFTPGRLEAVRKTLEAGLSG